MDEEETHWLRTKYTSWQKVTKEQWIEAERDAGFVKKNDGDYATASFAGGGIEGARTTDGKPPKTYAELMEMVKETA